MSKAGSDVRSPTDLLDDRDIRLGDYELDARLTAWLDQHVSSATLLTKEERVFAQRTRLTTTGAPTGRHVITDEAFETAITSLHASIASIDQQCAILEGHKRALASLRQGNVTLGSPALVNGHGLVKERARLDLQVESIAGSARAELQDHQQKVSTVITNTSNSSSRALEKDDRMIDSLQKLTPRLSVDIDNDVTLQTLDTLCKHWTVFERRAVRGKIDRTYADAVLKHSTMSNGDSDASGAETEVKAIQAELEELSNEIDGLVALVAEHRYRGSIHKSLGQARKDAAAESAKWSEYIACVLLFLTARLESLHELHQHSHVHRAALMALEQELKDVTADLDDVDLRSSTMRDAKQNGRGLKPLRLVQAAYTDAQETTAQILKLLNVKSRSQMDQAALAELLETTLQQRTRGHGDVLAHLSNEQHQMLQRSLNSPDQHLHALFKAISNSGFASEANSDTQKALNRLESHTDALATRIQSLDVDELARSVARALL